MIPRPPRSTLFPTRRSSDLLVDPQSLEVIKRMQTGLNTPLSDREVDTNRAVFPVSLYPGESVMMVVRIDRKSTRLNSSHVRISYAVFCLKKKKRSHIVTYNE